MTQLKITKGGVYTGDFSSVIIATPEPVTLQGMKLSGAGDLIRVEHPKASLVVDSVNGIGLNPNKLNAQQGRFLNADAGGFERILVSRCLIRGTRGIYIQGAGRSVTIAECHTTHLNDRFSDGKGGYLDREPGKEEEPKYANFVQLNGFRGVGSIRENVVTNDFGMSRCEDIINLFESQGTAKNPIVIEKNDIEGAFPCTVGADYSGGGIMCDKDSEFITIRNNVVTNTTNYGIAVTGGGRGILIEKNTVHGDGLAPNGKRFRAANVGMFTHKYYPSPNWGKDGGVTVRGNDIVWKNAAGKLNNTWFDAPVNQ